MLMRMIRYRVEAFAVVVLLRTNETPNTLMVFIKCAGTASYFRTILRPLHLQLALDISALYRRRTGLGDVDNVWFTHLSGTIIAFVQYI